MKTKIFYSIRLFVTVFTLLTVFSSCQKEPITSFTVSSTSVYIGESISFTNTTTKANSYEWNFGDGGNSTITNPTYTYNAIGTYTVTLTAFSKNEKKSSMATESITVVNETGTMTDTRDGQTYNTVKIGNQWWMAENLNYNTGNSWCYDDNSSNCNTYGRLYDYETALIAAPAGWHLATDEEWKTLEMHLGMSQSDADSDESERGTNEGDQLKETGTSHWYSANGATNSSGFTALPGGNRGTNTSFFDSGYVGYWWCSTGVSGTYEKCRNLRYDDAQVGRGNRDKITGLSVRCVKD